MLGIVLPLKIRHLEVFDALVEAGSVSRAADRLNLTQPAVSIALSKLEADLGFRLFHRERGYFAPTGEAMLLHSEVTQGLRAISRVSKRIDEIRLGTTGGVSIATKYQLQGHRRPRRQGPQGQLTVQPLGQGPHPGVQLTRAIADQDDAGIAVWIGLSGGRLHAAEL